MNYVIDTFAFIGFIAVVGASVVCGMDLHEQKQYLISASPLQILWQEQLEEWEDK